MQTYYIQFEEQLSEDEVSLFRGAFNTRHPDHLLFHNHLHKQTGEALRYAYPLIQYKRQHGCAGILGIDEGYVELQKLRADIEQSYLLGQRTIDLHIKTIRSEEINIRHTKTPNYYRISNWLPLNQENYRNYQKETLLAARIQMLEKILVGNILSFLKGTGITMGDTITCHIADITSQRRITYKNVAMLGFDLTFQCNVLLPEHIAQFQEASAKLGNRIEKDVFWGIEVEFFSRASIDFILN